MLINTSSMPIWLHSSNQIASKGVPRIGTRHLGTLFVIGRRRVPWPAEQKGLHCTVPIFNDLAPGFFGSWHSRCKDPELSGILIAIDERIVYDDLSSLGIKSECHLANPRRVHSIPNRRLMFGFTIQEQKAPAPSPGDLSTQSPVAGCYSVEIIDVCIRYL